MNATLTKQQPIRESRAARSRDVPASDAVPIVELDDVQLAFGENEVLRGVTLEVAPRARLVILGQSGSGKSTILRLLTGLLQADAGAVKFKGREISGMS